MSSTQLELFPEEIYLLYFHNKLVKVRYRSTVYRLQYGPGASKFDKQTTRMLWRGRSKLRYRVQGEGGWLAYKYPYNLHIWQRLTLNAKASGLLNAIQKG